MTSKPHGCSPIAGSPITGRCAHPNNALLIAPRLPPLNAITYLPWLLLNSGDTKRTTQLQPTMAYVKWPQMRFADKPSLVPCWTLVSSPSGADHFVYPIQNAKWGELWGGHNGAYGDRKIVGSTTNDSAIGMAVGFTGLRNEGDLIYARNRYMSASLGRWIERDHLLAMVAAEQRRHEADNIIATNHG
ncbi:MAG: hypothetical protein RLZZ373_3366, partial [Pseudomonadota bacterium]